MISRFAFCLVVWAFSGLLAVSAAEGHAHHHHGNAVSPIFPDDEHPALEHLPAGELRERLAGLPAAAQELALATMAEARIGEHDLSHLRVDASGGVFFVCAGAPAPEFDDVELSGEEEVDAPAISEGQTVWEGGFTPTDSVPISSPPVFHSNLGAPHVVYLDFNGDTITGSAWDSGTINARPYNLDSQEFDPDIFEVEEQLRIYQTWQRMSEDLSAYNINVTTDPYYDDVDNRGPNVGQVLFAHSEDLGSSAGGIAYVGVYGWSDYTHYQPAWVFYDAMWERADYMSEAGSHEFGHNIGMSHDGTSQVAYYNGHGEGETSWAPIMGVGYNKNVTQWSHGEYYDANQLQADGAMLEADLGLRADDHGNNTSTPTDLVIGDDGVIDPSLPANQGIITHTHRYDIDTFRFETGAGEISLRIDPFVAGSHTRGGNLDVEFDLIGPGGSYVARVNPSETTGGSVTISVPAGTYYIQVRGTGVGSPQQENPTGYVIRHSEGQYFISGTIVPVAQSESVAINFQPSSAPTVAGYLVDFGESFGNRSSGFSYGWDEDNFRARDRDQLEDQLLDTLNHCQKRGNRTWELELAEGDYEVTLTCSDPSYSNMINDFIIEGQMVFDVDGEDTLDVYTVVVAVADGRLTVAPALTAVNAKISAIEVRPVANSVAINFQPEGSPVVDGYAVDSGDAFADRGNGFSYGWDGDNFATRYRSGSSDPLYGTLNHAQESAIRTWELGLANGFYQVKLFCSDPRYGNMINDWVIEGETVLDPDGEDTFDELVAVVQVADGRLTLSPAVTADNAKISAVEIKRVPSVAINFQPASAPRVDGYFVDAGDSFADWANGYRYGWFNPNTGARDRNAVEDQRLDTLNHLQRSGDQVWELEVINGLYEVTVTCGDPSYSNSINNLMIEGAVVNDPDGYDNFDVYTVVVQVVDYRLTIAPADGASNAKINSIEVRPVPAISMAVNFQPESAPAVADYLVDSGSAFADRGNGYSYGWDGDNFRARDRELLSDQILDTLNHCQKRGEHVWELALPNGSYEVTLICGDPRYSDSINDFEIEGILISDPDGFDNLDVATVTVSVADGRLTVAPASSALGAKVNAITVDWVEIPHDDGEEIPAVGQ